MFIGICGPICSGKRTIADFLILNHHFVRLRLRSGTGNGSSEAEFDALNTSSPTTTNGDLNDLSDGLGRVRINGIQGATISGKEDEWFDSMGEMVEYVTKRWRQNFVTVDIWTEEDLGIVIKRPFFLLISVDAPISVRWKRFNERYIHAMPC
jgi:dCMP deaminase